MKSKRHVELSQKVKFETGEYALAACAVHIGDSMMHGHYVAWTCSDTGDYVRVSSGFESRHAEIGDDAAQNATMLFYQLQSDHDAASCLQPAANVAHTSAAPLDHHGFVHTPEKASVAHASDGGCAMFASPDCRPSARE